MVKITDIDGDIEFLNSLKNTITYSDRGDWGKVVKSYKATKKRDPGLETFYSLVYSSQKNKWINLAEATKGQWNALAGQWGMTGFQAFIMEGWKANLNSRYGVGKRNQSVYGAVGT